MLFDIRCEECVVTNVKPFKSKLGDGLDVDVEASDAGGKAYAQIVLYDRQAQTFKDEIKKGDIVYVEGSLRVKSYVKLDGTTGTSLLIERPRSFYKKEPVKLIEAAVPDQATGFPVEADEPKDGIPW